MTVAAPLAERAEPQAGSDDELNHIVCCDDDTVALCGTDVTEFEWREDEETTCVVCAYLDELEGETCDGVCPKLTRQDGAR